MDCNFQVNNFKIGDIVSDLTHDFVGIKGKIIDIYINFHDKAGGETLATVRFGEGDDEIVCDRNFEDIALWRD